MSRSPRTSDDPPGTAPTAGRARTWAAVVLVALAVAGAWAVLGRRSEPRHDAPTALFTVERGGLRYEYHAVTGSEALWDLSLAPERRRNLVRERTEDAERMRAELRTKLGVKDLDELRAPHRELYEHLKQLGYM